MPKQSPEPELNLKSIHNCPICKGTQVEIVNKTRTINPNSDLLVAVLKCTDCSHWFISPIPSQSYLNLLYKKASEYVVPKGWNAKKTGFTIPEKYIIKSESRTSNKKKKYLEIGIGSGLLLNYFRQIGYNCFGVEPGEWARGIPNVYKDINELDEDNFDVIVLVDVLEHVEEPLSLVRRLSELMNAGTVYASFPNSQSLRALLLKERWRMIRPFGHLHFFSRNSLLLLFESNGFRTTRLLKTDLLSMKNFLRAPYQLVTTAALFFGQHFWGDQWIVHLTKRGAPK